MPYNRKSRRKLTRKTGKMTREFILKSKGCFGRGKYEGVHCVV